MIVHTRVPAPRSSTDDCLHGSLGAQVEVLTRLLPDFAHVGVTATNDVGGLVTLAHVGDLARDLGALQHSSGEGPCIDTLRTGASVAAPDIGNDDRWRTYVPAAAAMGLRSQIAVPLLAHEGPWGSLDLYSTTQQQISSSASVVAEVVAVQVVRALMGQREIEHLRRALDNRACIGQATGMVMARLGIGADAAFSYLRRVSMQQNRKLALVAEEMVRTGRLPSTRPD